MLFDPSFNCSHLHFCGTLVSFEKIEIRMSTFYSIPLACFSRLQYTSYLFLLRCFFCCCFFLSLMNVSSSTITRGSPFTTTNKNTNQYIARRYRYFPSTFSSSAFIVPWKHTKEMEHLKATTKKMVKSDVKEEKYNKYKYWINSRFRVSTQHNKCEIISFCKDSSHRHDETGDSNNNASWGNENNEMKGKEGEQEMEDDGKEEREIVLKDLPKDNNNLNRQQMNAEIKQDVKLPFSPSSDRFISALSENGHVLVKVMSCKYMMREVAQKLRLSDTASEICGRTLISTMLVAHGMKENEKLQLSFAGDGPAERIMAISDGSCNGRVMISNPDVDLRNPVNGKPDISKSVGKGTLQVVKHHPDWKHPYNGIVEIANGEIAPDIACYLAVSEQRNTALGAGILSHELKTLSAG